MTYRDIRLLLGGLLLWILAISSGAAQERADTATPQQAPGAYVIGPGDTLQVFVWGNPDLSVTVPVRPDGRVSTPLIQDLNAVGKTPTQLEREMEQALSEYVRSPQVSVMVQGFVGAFDRQVRVLGQVVQARAVPYRESMTLLDVILEVGGLTDFAAANRSRVIRTQDGKRREFRVRLDDLLNKGRIEENMVMQPGDIVIVPEAIF